MNNADLAAQYAGQSNSCDGGGEKCLNKASLEVLANVQIETSEDLEKSEQPFVRYIFNRTY